MSHEEQLLSAALSFRSVGTTDVFYARGAKSKELRGLSPNPVTAIIPHNSLWPLRVMELREMMQSVFRIFFSYLSRSFLLFFLAFSSARAISSDDPFSSALRLVSDYGHGVMDPAVLERYLHAGVPVNYSNEGGATLLNLAVESYAYLQSEFSSEPEKLNSAKSTIQLLIAKGADAGIPDNSGMTPLMHLFRYGGSDIAEVFQTILTSKPDLSVGFRHSGFNILHFAATGARPEILQILLARPDLTKNLWKSRLKDGRTLFHIAANSRLVLEQKILLQYFSEQYFNPVEASIYSDLPDHANRSPLLNAVRANNIQAVKYLLENFQINPNRRSTDGDYPLLVAKELGNREMVDVLQKHGAILFPNQPEENIYCHIPNEVRVNFKTLVRIIEKCSLKTIDQLLGLLPYSYRSQYTQAFFTEAAQKASPEFPQTILFGRDGKFLMAFNGDPKLPGYFGVETIEFLEDSKTFELREIGFPKNNSGSVSFSEPNPAKCLNCHGTPPKPLWDNWTFWPGKFRGEQERFYAKEWSFYQRYLKNRRGNRYRHLPAPSTRSNISVLGNYGLGDNANVKLDEITEDLIAQQAIAQISKMKDFSEIKYAFLASLSCSDPVEQYIPKSVLQRLRYKLNDLREQTIALNKFDFDKRYELLTQILGSAPEGRYIIDQRKYGLDFPNSSGRNFDIERTTRLRFLFEGLGYSISSWFAEFHLRPGDQKLRYVASQLGYFEAHAWLNLLDSTLPVDRQFQEVIESLKGKMGQGTGYMPIIYQTKREEKICPKLKELAGN